MSESKLDLEAVKARRAAITGGEWESESSTNQGCLIFSDTPDGDYCKIAKTWDLTDAAFIANAPKDIDALVAEVERLRDRNYELLQMRHC